MIDQEFFFEATSRISSSLQIEKALSRCLLYIREVLPADALTLLLFDPGLGFIETVAYATVEGGVAPSLKTPLPSEVREQVQAYIKDLGGRPGCQIIDRLAEDDMARLVAQDLDALDEPCLLLDLFLEGEYLGIVAVTNSRMERYTEEHARLVLLLNNPFAMACANFLRYRALEELKDRLSDKCRFLQEELVYPKEDEVIGAGFGLKGVMEMVYQVAPTESPVLLLGETGVGKEVIANTIHRLSLRKEESLIKVDCAAIPESLVESELFGHEKGAYTGAVSRLRGRFERADHGTLFLDEIGELSPAVQKKLLRVLQEGVFERVGGSETLHADIRVIAATHMPIEAMIATGEFRKDLFFRLNVFPIMIPPLRDRREDIPRFVDHFIRKKGRKMRLPSLAGPAPGAIDLLMAYEWPGNIRELENCVERELILSRGRPLTFSSLWPALPENGNIAAGHPADGSLELDRIVTQHIRRVLDMTGGRVEGKRGAARLLGVHPRTLQHRMKRLNILFGRSYRPVAREMAIT